jgi:SAM-dependent methyltransferase
MDDADGRVTVGPYDTDESAMRTEQPGEGPTGPPGAREVAAPARPVPWLNESSPQAWDSYASQGGPDYLIADCGSAGSHEKRLRAVLRLPISTGDTLLEFGCGTGRLADFVPDGVRYEGMDWSGEVIAQARCRRPRNAFRLGSLSDLSSHDWVVASGPFNYAKGWSKSQTAEAIAAMWRASKHGIAFTVLRIPADRRLHYYGEELVSFLEACDWSHLELDRSYLPNDICLRAWRKA